MESLEARDVPTSLAWLGTVDLNFDNPTNWRNLDTGQTATAPPMLGDSLAFDGSVSNANVIGLHGFGGPDSSPDFAAIQLVNGYSGTVTLASDGSTGLSTSLLTLTSGAISQPTANTDLSVISSFTWTGGILNSSTFTSTVTILGSGTIAPTNGGTITSGSGLKFSGNSVSEFSPGTLILGNAADLVVEQFAFVGTQPGQPGAKLTVQGVGAAGKYLKLTGGVLAIDGWEVDMGLLIDGGTARVYNRKSTFTGRTAHLDWAVHLKSGTLIIDNGSTLAVGTKVVKVEGGKLATQATSAMLQGDATIEGALSVTGGTTQIVISDTTLNPTGVNGHKYGRLVVTENVLWQGGIFKPTVDGATGGTSADLWYCKKTFTVDTRDIPVGSQPKIDPIVIGAPVGGMAAGQTRKVIEADTALVVQGNGPGFVAPNDWELIPDNVNNPKIWSVRKK